MSAVDEYHWKSHIWHNRLQSAFLMLIMAAFAYFVGYLLWGSDTLLVLAVMFAVGIAFSPAFSPKTILRLYGARPLERSEALPVWRLVEALAERAGLASAPDLYYVPSQMLNAFSVGNPKHAAIAVTDGLLRTLTLRELAGVLAHEISHIRSNDLRVMALADMFSRATSIFSLIGQFLLFVNLPLIMTSHVHINWGAIALLIFSPTLSVLVQLSLARTREYNADLNAAMLTHDPEGLISALKKLENQEGGWLEQLLLPGRRVEVPSLLRTHPPTEERIARLRALEPKLSKEYHLLPAETENIHFKESTSARRPRWHLSGLWH